MKFMHEDLVSEFGNGGGKPSGSSRSTYSSICTTLAAYEVTTNKKKAENYITPAGEALLVKLEGLIKEFVDVRHPGGSKMDGKKTKEVDAVKELRDALADLEPVRRISRLLNTYSTLASHPHGGNSDLIRNSMAGWIDLLSRDVYKLVIASDNRINAQVTSDRKLAIHVPNFFATTFKVYTRGEYVPVGILVHEYHHHLTRGSIPAASVYPDEFVAHWKQYDAMGIILPMGRATCVADLNTWLLDDPRGYKRRFEVPAGSEYAGPEATGAAFWASHLDNAR